MNYFDFVEDQLDNSLKTKLDWNLERCYRKRLFGEIGQLPLMTNSEKIAQLGNNNWIQGTKWNNLLAVAEKQPNLNRHYYVPMDQHSSIRILLHGSGGPNLNITTLKAVQLPFKTPSIYSSSRLNKYVRELLKPLLEKTQQAF